MSYGYVRLRRVDTNKYTRHLGTLAWGTVDGRKSLPNAAAVVMNRMQTEWERNIPPKADAFVIFKTGCHQHDIREVLGIGVRVKISEGVYRWTLERGGNELIKEYIEGEL